MTNQKLIFISFLNAFGVAIYVTAISFIIRNGEKLFGKMDNFLGPVAFLMLFVLSALITGALVLGRPVIFYLENRKTDAIKLFFYTTGWLFVMTLVVLATQILNRKT